MDGGEVGVTGSAQGAGAESGAQAPQMRRVLDVQNHLGGCRPGDSCGGHDGYADVLQVLGARRRVGNEALARERFVGVPAHRRPLRRGAGVGTKRPLRKTASAGANYGS